MTFTETVKKSLFLSLASSDMIHPPIHSLKKTFKKIFYEIFHTFNQNHNYTLELQINTNLISHQHELHTMKHTSLERKQQKHGTKSKECVYLIYETVNWQALKRKYYDFATTNVYRFYHSYHYCCVNLYHYYHFYYFYYYYYYIKVFFYLSLYFSLFIFL